MSVYEGAEAVYGVTPMQRSMLLFSQAGAPGTYVGQLSCRLKGVLDSDALRRAFEALMQRHPALRTAFALEGLAEPLQVVKGTVALPFAELDWSTLGPADRDMRVQTFLAEDRATGFPLDAAPLMRVALIRLASDAHLLVWTRHHLLMDGWSMAAAIGELERLYRAELEATPAELPPVRPFQDYVDWLARRTGDAESDAAFWRQALAGLESPTLLVEGGGAHDAAEAALVELSRPLPKALAGDLKKTAQALGVSEASLLAAAWALVAGRQAGRDEAVVGLTVSGRPADLPGVEDSVGLFLNTLPLRLELPPHERLRDWLREAHARVADLEAHAHTPPETLRAVAEVPAERPLFDHILVLEGASMNAAPEGFAGLAVEDYRFIDQTTFALNVGVLLGTPPSLLVVYDPTRLDAGRAEALADDYLAALEAVAAAAGPAGERTLSRLEVLAPAHAAYLAERFNATEAPLADLRSLLARIAAQPPEATALAFGGSALRYGQLWQASGALAEELQAEGVGPETVVALVLERGMELPLAVLGVLRAGAVFLPLDPDDPPARLRALLAESGAHLVLTQAGAAERLGDLGPPARPLGAADLTRRPQVEPPLPEGQGAGAAYAIFTSGSTGRPKAVVNTHGGLLNRVDWMQRAYPLAPGARVLHKTPCTFDVSVWELLWPLTAGATMVIAEPGGHRDPTYLRDLIAGQEVTLCHFVPSMLRAFLAAPGIEACGSLRQVICSGEALAGADRDLLRRRLPQARLANLYGPAEAAIDVSVHDCAPGESELSVPIGRPIANTRLHLLDRRLRRVPPGAAGELHIAGANLARGYLGRAGLTAERFVPDPFATEPGARLYRTGDLARFDAAGELVYLGRSDFQVKLRGMRIETGEIEAALAALPEVREAAVVLDRHDGEPRLVAHLVAADGAALAVETLRTRLAAVLPEALIPAVFVPHAALPLSPNGKLDRAALARAVPGARVGPAFVAPRTEEEATIAAIWAEVLGQAEVGVTTDFFALGGHSLLLVQVAARLRDAFEVEVSLRRLFNARTVEAMLDAVLEAELESLDPSERAAFLAETGGG